MTVVEVSSERNLHRGSQSTKLRLTPDQIERREKEIMLINQFKSTIVPRSFLRVICVAIIGLVISFGSSTVNAYSGDDVVVGTIEKIDAEGKKIYVKSKDGAVRVFKWTKNSTAHGIESARVWTDHALHTGAHIVVRVGKVAGEDVIKGLHWVGSGTMYVAEATVRYVGKGTKKLEVAVVDKGKEIYEISEHAVVKTGSKVWHKTKDIEKHSMQEAKAIVHYFERDGKKVVHYVERNAGK